MAVVRLNKLFIVSHKSDARALLKKLQRNVKIEIKPFKEEVSSKIQFREKGYKRNIKVERALNVLNDFKDIEIKKAVSKAGKLVVKREEYNQILEKEDYEEIADSIIDSADEIINSEKKIIELSSQIHQLEIWLNFKGDLTNINRGDLYTIKLGIIKSSTTDFTSLESKFNENQISYQVLKEEGNIFYVILAYHNDFKEKAERFLLDMAYEEAEISNLSGTIEENLNSLEKSVEFHKNRKESLKTEIEKITEENERSLVIYLDYLENNLEIEEAIYSGYATDSVSFYTAWIKKDELPRVKSLLNDFKFVRFEEIQPEEGETIPVLLENKPLFRPFELVVNLYGIPRYFEIDPTPFVSLFFGLFFGLCLTDAGYGIILSILTIVFAFKVKKAKNFLMLIFIGAIFTIFAGALFNGWFGDLPSYLGIDGFFNKLAIFGDPVKSEQGSMNFFRLALLLGVIHIIFGLFINFFENLRKKDWSAAFLDGLTWIVIIISLVIILLSSQIAVSMQLISEPLFTGGISKILMWPILLGAIIIIFFGARDQKSWGLRIFMGFLNLTIVNGLTSYMGDFLSYIRLMALGLVTAGIGVAINKIAFQFLSIPGIGIVLLVVVLIFGHIFNIGINILGGFVHTLRLQYVEFFPKFYVGGGKPFEALKNEHKYITIVD